MTNQPARFWADLSRKTGTWAGVTALALAIGEQVEEWLDATAEATAGPHHVWAVIAVAVLRAVIGLVQGKVGDPNKASFTNKDAPTVNVPTTQLRDDPAE